MSNAPKPSARTDALAVIFSADEKAAFRKKCSSIGTRCSTEARRIFNAWNPLSAPANSKPRRPPKEYPGHGHVANFPNRASRGGAPRPSRF